jgi:hypothetical protein
MPGVIDEQLFETDTPVPTGGTINSRLIDVRGAQHVSVSLFLGPERGNVTLNCNIGFRRTADSQLVFHRAEALRDERPTLSISVPVCGPLLQVHVVSSPESEAATCGGWVYAVREVP